MTDRYYCFYCAKEIPDHVAAKNYTETENKGTWIYHCDSCSIKAAWATGMRMQAELTRSPEKAPELAAFFAALLPKANAKFCAGCLNETTEESAGDLGPSWHAAFGTRFRTPLGCPPPCRDCGSVVRQVVGTFLGIGTLLGIPVVPTGRFRVIFKTGREKPEAGGVPIIFISRKLR